MIYNLISETTREIVGYTTIGPFDTDHDIPNSELLDVRLEAAIDDGHVQDDAYYWQKSKQKIGVLI